MAKERFVLNSDLRYIDRNNLLRTRSELSVAKILSFLSQEYEYDASVTTPDGESVRIDFKAGGGGGEERGNDSPKGSLSSYPFSKLRPDKHQFDLDTWDV